MSGKFCSFEDHNHPEPQESTSTPAPPCVKMNVDSIHRDLQPLVSAAAVRTMFTWGPTVHQHTCTTMQRTEFVEHGLCDLNYW